MTNEELIKGMSRDVLGKFLFRFKINTISNFLKYGGAGLMDATEQKEWLASENNGLIEKIMGEGEFWGGDRT